VNAPKLFEEMVKNRIAPALRDLGMRGSGQHFRLPNENGDYALLGFQKDSWDGTTRFTANVAFYGRQAWQDARARESWMPTAPSATTTWSGVAEGWQERVGFLIDPPHDHWWTIQTESDVPLVADHVVATVRDAVLPQLQARLAGAEPPPQPIKEMGPVPDCPAPTCAYPPVAWVEDADLGNLGSLLAAEGGEEPGLDAAQREVLGRARGVAVPRTQAWKALHISRARLDTYADRLGAGPALTFVQLLVVDLLGTDDLLSPMRWPDALVAVDEWAERLPDADLEAALVLSEDAVAVLPLAAALTPDNSALPVSVVQPLMPAAQYLLEELSQTGVV
jgi:hypothetical protein